MRFAVKYSPHIPMFRKKLLLTGWGELHVTETALIVEADCAKFYIPFVGSYYIHLLADWTTCTVPYGRVVRYRYTGTWFHLSFMKCVLLLLLAALSAFGLYLLMSPGDTALVGAVVVGLGVVSLLLVAVSGRREHRITWLDSSGKKVDLRFKIKGPPEQMRADFSRRFQEYMTAAQAFQTRAPQHPGPQLHGNQVHGNQAR